MTPLDPPPDLALLDRYLAGECSAREAALVREWLAKDPAHLVILDQVALVRDVAAEPEPEIDTGRMWAAVQRGVSGEEARRTSRIGAWVRPVRRTGVWVAAAASVVLAVALWRSGVFTRDSGDGVPGGRTYATGRGERDAIRLSDGSRVELGPASRLLVPASYGRSDRALRLEGSAVFDVRHDAAHPFSVRSARALTEDIGTTFLVRDYDADRASRVAVRDGRVRVVAASTGEGVAIGGGDAVRVASGDRVPVRVAADAASDFGWVDGQFTAHDERLAELLLDVNRWYDIDVRVDDPALADQHVSTSWNRESPDSLVAGIAALVHARVERQKGHIVLVPDHTGR